MLLTHVWQKSRNVGNEKRIIEHKTILDRKKNNFKNWLLRQAWERYGTFKMKTILNIIICFLLLGCVNNKGEQKEEQTIEVKQDSSDTLTKEETYKTKEIEFDIGKFKKESDSLLKSFKGENYFFDLQTDIFDFRTDNPETFTKGHGIFWQLYQDTSERIVRHLLYVPNTKKQLRIYLVEAEYKNKEHLEKVISKLEKTMNDSINAPDSDDFQKWRLSPISDYIIASDNKMYWLNGSYPYSNREFLQFIDCLKNNIDRTKFKGRIICLFGKDCENENVP